jgi:UDP-N-acetylmuramate dehydrogenase
MNAGAGGTEIGEYVVHVEGIRMDGSDWAAAGSDVRWAYRGSSLPEDVIVTRAWLRTPQAAETTCRRRLEATREERRTRQPAERSAGCVFRNPRGESAGKLLDQCACTGLHEGGVRVSEAHANFLVAEPGAREADFVALTCRLQRRVFRRTGYVLAPEVRFVGLEASRRVRVQTDALRYEAARAERGGHGQLV